MWTLTGKLHLELNLTLSLDVQGVFWKMYNEIIYNKEEAWELQTGNDFVMTKVNLWEINHQLT